ncbi:MAG: type II toxin-antitoxin system RelE/ParE family toxin [Planctomycetaceae bacterium]
MSRIIWPRQSEQDLRSIRDFIARDSRQYAKTMVDRIKKAVAGCRRFPEAAGIVPEFGDPSVREIFVACRKTR